MKSFPYRTNATWFSDQELILLDLFCKFRASFAALRNAGFADRYDVPYTHNFSDDELQMWLDDCCRDGILQSDQRKQETYYQFTERGGELWSQERCPIWDRYCREHYHRRDSFEMMTVIAVSPHIRDDYLEYFPRYSLRRKKTTTIPDFGLIPWKSFPKLYVGLVTCDTPPRNWGAEEYYFRQAVYFKHNARLAHGRTWWRFLDELQQFIPRERNYF